MCVFCKQLQALYVAGFLVGFLSSGLAEASTGSRPDFLRKRHEIERQPRTFDNDVLFLWYRGEIVRSNRFTGVSGVLGDFDGDADVDLFDYNAAQVCHSFSGPEFDIPPACDVFDFDGDHDLDLEDMAAFMAVFTGRLAGAVVEAGELVPIQQPVDSYYSGEPGAWGNNALNGTAAQAGYTQDDLWYEWAIEAQPDGTGDVILSNSSLPATAYTILAPVQVGWYRFKLTVTNLITFEFAEDTATLSVFECSTHADCDDGDACTVDACDAVDVCSNTPVYCAEGKVCDSETGTCEDPGCLLDAACDDGNPCTTDVCNSNRDCEHTNNTGSCEDGLFCNGADSCSGGTCSVHVGDPCAGGGECANHCDESGNTCNRPGGTQCTDDGDVCTDDMCSGGQCTHPNNTAPCDDGQFCTATDTCSGGHCIGSGSPCPKLCAEIIGCFDCFTSLDCDDGVSCTDDICGLSGLCTFFPNSVTCNDGDLCTADTCDAVTGCGNVEVVFCTGTEICNPGTGICEPIPCETPAECADADACTDDTCAPDGTCRNTVVICDDGLFCNGAEQCDSETGCVLGIDPCDDGVDCTDDCDEEVDQCTNTPNDGLCADDGVFCNGSEMCDPLAGCISPGDPCPPGYTCDESAGMCDIQPTTWASTQALLPEAAYSPPESYELDVSRQLTIAHLGLSEENLRPAFQSADITIFTTDVLPRQDTLMYRTEEELAPGFTQITTQTLTINDFHLSFTREGESFTATWAFDYVRLDTDSLFGTEVAKQFAGTQTGDVSEDGTVITWTGVEGTVCTLDQGICNNPGELTEINFPLGIWTRN